MHPGSSLLYRVCPIPTYLNILGYLGTTLAIERAASNGSFDPPEGWGWQKNVMNSYLGKDLTFVFLKTFAYEFSNFSHKHTRTTVSQVHVVLCSRWAWRLKKYPFSVTKLIINFSEQSQIGSKIVVTNHMSLSSTHI